MYKEEETWAFLFPVVLHFLNLEMPDKLLSLNEMSDLA